jgi:hypothetical protein
VGWGDYWLFLSPIRGYGYGFEAVGIRINLNNIGLVQKIISLRNNNSKDFACKITLARINQI